MDSAREEVKGGENEPPVVDFSKAEKYKEVIVLMNNLGSWI